MQKAFDKTLKMTHIKYIFLILFVAGISSSCKKLVEVETPNTLLLRKSLFENAKSAETALAGMYVHMKDKGFLSAASSAGALVKLGIYSDEMLYVSESVNDNYQFHHYYVLSTNPVLQNYWNYSFQTIFLANSILEAEKESLNLPQENRDRLIGEALFVRALCHFYLTNTFGSIPYIVSTDYRQTNSQGKISVKEIYKLAIADLLKAESLLKETYPIAERVRPNKWVVKSLLARVYLYDEDWANASLKSSEVIGHNVLYSLEPTLERVFLKDSKEAIWQFKPIAEGSNAYEGQTLILTQDPSINGYPVSGSLMNAFEAGDLRKEKWIGTFTLGNQSWPFFSKYKQRIATTVSAEYSVLFRLAEQYFIRAEAKAQQNDLSGALADLNKIRNRAGLSDADFKIKEDVLEAILKERRIELSAEYGHRFYDLKRTGKADQYLKPVKPNWKKEFLLWPIPYADLEANKNLLPQNPGYN